MTLLLRACMAFMALSCGVTAISSARAEPVMQDKFVFSDESFGDFGTGGRSYALTSARDGTKLFATFLAVQGGDDPVGVEFSNSSNWQAFLRLWRSANTVRAAALAQQPSPAHEDLLYTDSSGAKLSMLVLDLADAPLSVLITQTDGHDVMFQISGARIAEVDKAIEQISTRFPASVK